MRFQAEDLKAFPKQIAYALHTYSQQFSAGLVASDPRFRAIDNIMICGLGGSGIAGRIVKSLFIKDLNKPVEILSDYFIPKWANSNTLALMCSYSGNTEETLEMYEMAKEQGCAIICMATGGELKTRADNDGNVFIIAEGGYQPRMALGYSLTYLLMILSEMGGLDQDSIKAELEVAIEKLSHHEHYLDRARHIFSAWHNELTKKVAIISDYYTANIGTRFAQQVQENAKGEAFVSELPETNHNVIETYYGKVDSHFLFIDSCAHPRTDLRVAFLRNLLSKANNSVQTLYVEHGNILSVLEAIFVLDWLSLLLADAKGIKSMDVNNIAWLKTHLSQH